MDKDINNGEYIPLADAKISIISALTKFHPELGKRASDILYNDERLNIVENPEQTTGMMQCRPAGLTKEHLIENDMYFPDFEDRFGTSFTEQENHTDHAIIDYEYLGTQDSIVYLAHELGHAIADDIQIENGKSFKDFTPDQAEKQAYFIQSIYSHYTGHASAESSYLGNEWERADQYKQSNSQFQQGLAMGMDERQELIIKALSQQTNPADLNLTVKTTNPDITNAHNIPDTFK